MIETTVPPDPTNRPDRAFDAAQCMLPDPDERRRLYAETIGRLERYIEAVPDLPVVPTLDAATLRKRLAAYDFAVPRNPEAVISDVIELLEGGIVHVASPRYFGLFNPTPAFLGGLADLITATFNPQLAVWSHAPAAIEIERHLVTYLGGLFGLPCDRVAGHFTTGGAEANLAALLLALTRAQPAFAEAGARALPGQPVFYASADSHLAWFKIAHACGLGRSAARLVRTDEFGRLDPAGLAAQIAEDRAAGLLPVMIVATAGTTGAGAIDPLPAIADVADAERLHLHIDAAWGGAAILSNDLAPCLAGIERAASITMDAHKWLAVPMGAGMFLCTDNEGLYETFRIATAYMPVGLAGADPYTHSMQWSRRFIGLKLFLMLTALGRSGYAAVIEAETALGRRLRARLAETGWRVVNDTPLPVVCFVDEAGTDPVRIAEAVVESGQAWISTTKLAGQAVLRACITSYRSRPEDIEALIRALDAARREPASRGQESE
jgi:glutamate/tyrosine decarboxylase-like PLP-dependent enzyme